QRDSATACTVPHTLPDDLPILTVTSPVPWRDSARTVHCPGAAKKRNTPSGEDTTSAVNSPLASSSRTYAPATGRSSARTTPVIRSEEHTSELQSREKLVCRLQH